MVAPLFDLQPVLPALQAGELILTANDRLRRHMLRAWGDHQRQQGLNAWHQPAVHALNRWLDQQWQTLVELGYPECRGIIAGRHQRQLLWEQVITESPQGSELLQPEPLARHADAALRSLTLWNIDLDSLGSDARFYQDANSLCFSEWLRTFQQLLDRQQLIIPESAQQIVARAFREDALPRLARIHLHGFDDLPPLHRELLGSAAAELVQLPGQQLHSNRVQRTQLETAEEEVRAAALWSLAQLQSDPESVIGIIVPDLGQRRDQVERIFSEVFEPHAALPESQRYTLPFNFSAGIPLGSVPLIHSALGLLGLLRDQWELEAICTLIHSPFWSEPERETVLRAQLATRLRKLGKFTVTGSDLRFHAQRLCEQLEDADRAPSLSLAGRLQQLDTSRRQLPRSASAGQWAELFRQQLALLGWPGTRRLDSQEYQQFGQWYLLLEEFTGLDATGTALNLSQALRQLSQLALQTPFQAQTPDSPIQILGALEGAGLRFSHCWVLGLHHRQWPPAPAPNPLLPLTLQRQTQMPHASAERELHYARSLTDNYRHCAPRVVFSSSASDEEGDLRPSALIRDIPLTESNQLLDDPLSCSQRNYQRLAAARALQPVNCAKGPAFDLALPAPGGSHLLKQQASCPFNAFAELRLNARLPDSPTPGFSPAERGTLLHDALAEIWRELKTSETLHTISEEALETLVEQACNRAIAPIQQRRPRELGPVYCRLEQQRLQRLLHDWLTMEKIRSPFTVVAVEEAQEIVFAGLKLKLRIDRIDQLENGEHLLIDYKTGQPGTQGWLGERPDEPQLPLYAITQPDTVAAVAFAQLNAKGLKWTGFGQFATPPLGLEGIAQPPMEWPQLLDEWQQVLRKLATDFIAGDARVDFKDANAERYSAELLPLNRALEAQALQEFLTDNTMEGHR